ncbi:MAG: DUF3592 domain-containing protein [Ruminococcaceae bacterium]|nr:DUF3592 domain-containing protein [Oscillospiraceae bacterium]
MSSKRFERQDFLPLCLAVLICLLTLHAAMVELPDLVSPKAAATVISVAEGGTEIETYDDFGNTIEYDGSAYVEYEAEGDKWTAMLEKPPKNTREGDRLPVAYNAKRPDEVRVLRPWRTAVMLSLLTLSVCAYGMLWGMSVSRRRNEQF